MNNTNETIQNIICPDNIINHYGALVLCWFIFLLNIFFSIISNKNINKSLENLNINKVADILNDYIKNDNIIIKKNNLIKKHEWLNNILIEEDKKN